MSNDLVSPQPAPIPTASRPIWELVIEDMRARDQFGREKYKTPLQAGNGRDALVDAYQEALDLCAYLKQELVERAERPSSEEVARLRSIASKATEIHAVYQHLAYNCGNPAVKDYDWKGLGRLL